MKIIKEDILRMFFDEGKGYGEIAKVYGMSEYKLKKEIKNMSLFFIGVTVISVENNRLMLF